MTNYRPPVRVVAAILLSVAAVVLTFYLARAGAAPAPSPAPQRSPAKAPPKPPAAAPSEAVLRLNNLGIAEMEQFHFTQAASHFEKARAQAPHLTAADVNLAMALFYDRKNDEAESILKDVVTKNPRQREAHYVLGLLHRSAGRNEEALAQMKAVLALDPQDPATLYFTGALNSAQHNWEAAVQYLREALARDPINVSIYYALATALVQKGDTPQAEKVMAQFQELKARGTGTSYGNQYLEQGRYAQTIQLQGPAGLLGTPGAGRPQFADQAGPGGLNFVHAGPRDAAIFDAAGRPQPAATAAFGSGLAFFDYDGDGSAGPVPRQRGRSGRPLSKPGRHVQSR